MPTTAASTPLSPSSLLGLPPRWSARPARALKQMLLLTHTTSVLLETDLIRRSLCYRSVIACLRKVIRRISMPPLFGRFRNEIVAHRASRALTKVGRQYQSNVDCAQQRGRKSNASSASCSFADWESFRENIIDKHQPCVSLCRTDDEKPARL